MPWSAWSGGPVVQNGEGTPRIGWMKLTTLVPPKKQRPVLTGNQAESPFSRGNPATASFRT